MPLASPVVQVMIDAVKKAARPMMRDFGEVSQLQVSRKGPGDFVTAADLKAWKTNRRSEGFLPEEREWFGSILGPRTLVDVVRRLHPDAEGPYSWWSWRGQAFVNDAGWRIDYHLASAGLAARAVAGGTHRAPSYEARISDHAPVVVDYDV